MSSSVQDSEIKKFSRDAPHWWDEDGPFKPLHRLNPVRMHYIKDQICNHTGRNSKDIKALKGLSILDIGCGGGLACEPLSRMGAKVTGIDADPVAIEVARDHASQSGLDIDYRNESAEIINDQYDVVLALEIVEHVSDAKNFVQTCADRVKPGGLLIMSTLNRTAKSFALGIIAAEYILRWVPQGTHSWKKFVKPSELARAMRASDLSPEDVTGLIFNPLENKFTLSRSDIDVNYLMTATKRV